MLSIDNLHAGCEGKTILQGINLDVKPGEVHAIMGPNGSGKSTLSTVVAGHEDYEISRGTILFDGEDIADLSADERAHKGIFLSFQYPVEIPGVTVTNFIKTAINQNRKVKGNPNLTVIGHMTDKSDGANLVTRGDEVIPLKAQGWKAF